MPIGKLLAGLPATAVAGEGDRAGYVAVFVKNMGGAVLERPYRNGQWRDWSQAWNLNPGLTGGLSAAARPGYVGFAASDAISGKVAILQRQNGKYALQYQGGPGVYLTSAPSLVAASSGYIGALISSYQDGHLYELYFDGNWNWTDHGPPANNGVPTGAKAQEVSFTASPSSDYVGGLVRGDDGHIYEIHFADEGTDWPWMDHGPPANNGVPTGAKATGSPAFVVDDTGYRGGLVAGTDGSLYELYFDGAWHWADHGPPANNGVPTGAKAIRVSALAARLPPGYWPGPPADRYVGGLVNGDDGHVYEIHYANAGRDWPWTDWGTQDGTGATAATAAPCMVAAPYGYLGGFIVGNDLNLHELAYNPGGNSWYWGIYHGGP
jgi:hypothetical protein